MTLTEMRGLLAKRDLQLTKSLGQNFLHDGNQLRRIVNAACLRPTDRVFEIGPGLGPLTELLLAESGEVFAIEMDRRLVEFLKTRFLAAKNFTLLHADALKHIQREPRDWTDWKLVANLPYSVASPILVELAQSPQPPQLMVVTLQHEVAQRLVQGRTKKTTGCSRCSCNSASSRKANSRFPRAASSPSRTSSRPASRWPGVHNRCCRVRRRKFLRAW